MTVSSWQPNKPTGKIPENALSKAVHWSEPEQFFEPPGDDLKPLQAFMKVAEEQWTPLFEGFSDDELKLLCRFFTLAEHHWSDWFGGDKNPAIWVVNELKRRGAWPDKTLLGWIRQHSDNRFLPYGNLMGKL